MDPSMTKGPDGPAAVHRCRPHVIRALVIAISLACTSAEWAAGADLDPIKTQLDLARDYMAQGNYARAKIEFEKVLRIDDLDAEYRRVSEALREAA